MDDIKANSQGFYSSSVKIKKEDLIALLKCPLCNGIFRTPTTINECMDSFCKSCIYKWFYEPGSAIRDHCPKCQIKLGGRPLETLIFDSSLSVLVDILFPEFEQLDKTNAQKMYQAFRDNKEPLLDKNENNNKPELNVFLYPFKSPNLDLILPPIQTRIRVPKQITIASLISYLSQKLTTKEEDINLLYKSIELVASNTLEDIIKLYGIEIDQITFHYLKKEIKHIDNTIE